MGNLSPGKSPVKPPHPTRARNFRRLSEPTPGAARAPLLRAATRRSLVTPCTAERFLSGFRLTWLEPAFYHSAIPEETPPGSDIPAGGGGAIRGMGAVRGARPRRNEARNRPPHGPPPHRRGLTRELDRIDSQFETSRKRQVAVPPGLGRLHQRRQVHLDESVAHSACRSRGGLDLGREPDRLISLASGCGCSARAARSSQPCGPHPLSRQSPSERPPIWKRTST